MDLCDMQRKRGMLAFPRMACRVIHDVHIATQGHSMLECLPAAGFAESCFDHNA